MGEARLGALGEQVQETLGGEHDALKDPLLTRRPAGHATLARYQFFAEKMVHMSRTDVLEGA